jgi:hypothetical protein
MESQDRQGWGQAKRVPLHTGLLGIKWVYGDKIKKKGKAITVTGREGS